MFIVKVCANLKQICFIAIEIQDNMAHWVTLLMLDDEASVPKLFDKVTRMGSETLAMLRVQSSKI